MQHIQRRNSSGFSTGVDLNNPNPKHSFSRNYKEIHNPSCDDDSTSGSSNDGSDNSFDRYFTTHPTNSCKINNVDQLSPQIPKQWNNFSISGNDLSQKQHKASPCPSLSSKQIIRCRPLSDYNQKELDFSLKVPKKNNLGIYVIIVIGLLVVICFLAVIHISLEKSPIIINHYPTFLNGNSKNAQSALSSLSPYYGKSNVRGGVNVLDEMDYTQEDSKGDTMINKMMNNMLINASPEKIMDGRYSEGMNKEDEGNHAGAIHNAIEPNLSVLSNSKESPHEWDFSDIPILLQAPKESESIMKDTIRGGVNRLDKRSNTYESNGGEVISNLLLNPGPDNLSTLSNFKETSDEWETSDVPIFLHIPKAGGSTIKDILGMCHRFVMADEMGVTDGHADDTEIAVVYPGGGPIGQDRSPFVNVDTTTMEGIQRASDMGFSDSGLADAVITPFLYEANFLFTPTAKGRLFTVFRHPIERAISMFYYLQIANWEPTFDLTLKDMTIEQYAKSDRIENNWLTRTLSNHMEGELKDVDLNIARDVLRRKFFVGLVSNIEKTMELFERYFRWTYHVNPPNQEICRAGLVSTGSNSNQTPQKDKPKEGDPVWELFVLHNKYDLELYTYIESLFLDQEKHIEMIPADFRNIDATCCKCGPPTYPPEGFNCPYAIQN